jgi:hypothetical protein
MKLSYWKSPVKSVPDRIYIKCPESIGILLWAEKYGINDFVFKYKAGSSCIKSKWEIECYISDTKEKIGMITWSYLMDKAKIRRSL